MNLIFKLILFSENWRQRKIKDIKLRIILGYIITIIYIILKKKITLKLMINNIFLTKETYN